MEITKEIAQKVLSTVDAGLVAGLGQAIPGKMCVEAAVCYALGLPHGDKPSCVASSLRNLKIRINDANWSFNKARAAGLRKLAILQLGTAGVLDEKEFAKRVVLFTINRVLAKQLFQTGLMASALGCEKAANLKEAADAARAAAITATDTGTATAAYNTANTAVDAAEAAAADACDIAITAFMAGADACDTATVLAAAAVAYAADNAAAAYTAAPFACKASDAVLNQFVEGVANILIEMGVPGTQWLDLL